MSARCARGDRPSHTLRTTASPGAPTAPCGPQLRCGSGREGRAEAERSPWKAQGRVTPLQPLVTGTKGHRLRRDPFAERHRKATKEEKEHLPSPTRGLWVELLLLVSKSQ